MGRRITDVDAAIRSDRFMLAGDSETPIQININAKKIKVQSHGIAPMLRTRCENSSRFSSVHTSRMVFETFRL